MLTWRNHLAASCGLAALIAAMPATAQTEPTPSAPTSAPGEPAPPRPDDPAAPAPERDIIVTGTRITRPNNHSAAPVTTVTSTDIAAQGATTIEEVLNRLPQVQANAEQNYGESEGRQRIKLRSLGFERTLTLVDGLRLGLQNGMDVGIIPNALIDRIDVLSGGASSVYGSDAVSGVVNFILKKDFDGIRLEGGYSFFDHVNRANAVTEAAARADFPWPHGRTADGGRANVSLAAGHQWLDGALRLSAFAGYRHSDQVSLMDRSLSACEVSQKLSTGRLTCTRSTYTATGTVVPGGIGQGRTLVNDPLGAGTFVPFASGRGTAANPFDELPFQRHFDRINTGVFVSADMSDEVELYATALFYRDQSYNTVPTRVYSYSAYGKEPYHTNCDNPFLSTPQRIALCGAATSGLVPLDVRYRFDGLPPTRLRFEDQGVRVTGGLRGRVLDGAWGYDLSGVYSLLKARAIYPAQPDEKRVNRALNVVAVNGVPTCAAALDGTDKRCVPFNAFAPYNSDARVPAYLFTRTDGTEGDLGRLWQGLAVLNGDLGRYGITSPLAEQGVALALGAEARAEHFGTRADRQFRQTNGGRDQHFTQRIYEVNAEAQVPVIEHQRFTDLLQLNGGYRVSRYDRLRGRFTTWKGEGVWQPIADIGLRGSINKAQRAPTVIEADQASNIYYDTIGPNDPCASTPDPNTSDPNARLAPTASLTQCRRTGLPDRLYGSASLSCLNEACTVRSGGFDLKPETAYTKTFGVILRPRALKGLTLSVDRFVIHLTDSINYFAVADFLSGCLTTGLDYYCRGVRRAPDTYRLDSAPGTKPTSGYLVRGTGNGYRSQSSGWDVQAQYGLGLGGAGRLDLSLNGSLVTRVGVHDSPDSRPRNCVGYYGGSCGESMPRWSHGAGATWASPGGAIHLGTNWRHIGAMAIAYNAPERTGIPADEAQFRHFYTGVPTYDYVDLSSSFEIGKVYTLRFSVNNLLDRDPPLLPDSRSTLGLLRGNTLFRYDLLGRQLAASVSMKL